MRKKGKRPFEKRSIEQKRRDYLYGTIRREGQLKCLYCGRNDLIVGPTEDPSLMERIATVDHVSPRNGGKTGPKKTACGTRKNWAIACKECNNAKDNLSVSEFSKIKEQIILPWDYMMELKFSAPEEYEKVLLTLKENRKLVKKNRHN